MVSDYIRRMAEGESIIRIGHIWYGVDSLATVTSVSFAPETNIRTIRSLRMEAATAFSTGRVAEKTVVVTIVVNYEGFRKYVQELDAMKRVSPVVPVQGQLITTLIDPSSIRTAGDNAVSTEYALASAEHFMHIDGIT